MSVREYKSKTGGHTVEVGPCVGRGVAVLGTADAVGARVESACGGDSTEAEAAQAEMSMANAIKNVALICLMVFICAFNLSAQIYGSSRTQPQGLILPKQARLACFLC